MKIAITGTIGSGKSAALKIINDLGFKTFDCDEIAHSLQIKGAKGYLAIANTFENVLNDDNSLNRQALAKSVFNDQEALTKLNAIMLTLIKERLICLLAENDLAIVEVPLLFESGFANLFDKSILITCRQETAIKRLLERGLNYDEIMQRIESQMDVEIKKILADYVIENDDSLVDLKFKINKVLKEMGIC